MSHTSLTIYADGTVIGWVHKDGGCENARCLAAIAAGRPHHAIPRIGTLTQYHYATIDEAVEAVERAAQMLR